MITKFTCPIRTGSLVSGRANSGERHGRELESQHVCRFCYGSVHSADNVMKLTCPIRTGSSVSGRANSGERHGREFESHQVCRFSYGSGHSADNVMNLTFIIYYNKE